MAKGRIRFPQKPVSVEGCSANWVAEYLSLTLSHEMTPAPSVPDTFPLYKLSYMYYTVVGTLTAIAVGIVVSYLTGCNKGKEVNPKLYSPIIYRFLPKKNIVHEVKFEKNDAKVDIVTK